VLNIRIVLDPRVEPAEVLNIRIVSRLVKQGPRIIR